MPYDGQTETGQTITITLTTAQADALDSIVEGWTENAEECERCGEFDEYETTQLHLVQAAARVIGDALRKAESK